MAKQQGWKSSGGHSPRKKHNAQLEANREAEKAAKLARRKSVGISSASVRDLVEGKKK
jgi:hypothetical protein